MCLQFEIKGGKKRISFPLQEVPAVHPVRHIDGRPDVKPRLNVFRPYQSDNTTHFQITQELNGTINLVQLLHRGDKEG